MRKALKFAALKHAALATALALVPAAASAQSWRSHTTVHGPHGVTTIDSHGGGTWASGGRSTTIVGPHGGVTTQHVTRSYDPASRTWIRETTVTGPHGGTRSVYGTRTYYGGAVHGSRTVTGPYGHSRTTTWRRVR